MKILSLNTWQECGPWKDRWEIIFKGIQEMKPEVIGFQEVFNPAWAEEIQKRTGYATLVFPKELGGLLILSRYPAIRSECLTFKTKSFSEDYFRYILFAELKTEKGSLAVFDTHWSWKLMESSVRQKQAQEFLDFTRKAGNVESVAMGDFNCTAWSPEIRLLKEAGWMDTFAAVYPDKPGLTWANANSYAFSANHPMPDRRIDYIFVHQKGASKILGQPDSVQIVFTEPDDQGRFASDHYGILTTFR